MTDPTDPTDAHLTVHCVTCGQLADWIDCPTGGWWSHHVHPDDGHDAAPDETDLIEEMQRLRAEVLQGRAERAKVAHELLLAERKRHATLAGACRMLGMPDNTAEPDVFEAIRRLRVEVPRARAAGYRNAADNAAEMVATHGADADAQMLLVFLASGAELRERFANTQTVQES